MLNSILNFLRERLETTFSHSEHQITLIGSIAFIFFPVYYFIWHNLFPQMYANLALRSLGSVVGLGLMTKNFWPKKHMPIFKVYWYFAALFCLPFFSLFILFKNYFATIPLMISMMSVFLLLLLMDWLNSVICFVLGAALAWLAFYFTTPVIPDGFAYDFLQYLSVYAFTILAGSVLNYKTALMQQEKMAGMNLLGRTIGHELRTPLAGIRAGAQGLQKYLPKLFTAYEAAKQAGLNVPLIRRAHMQSLEPIAKRIELEAHYSNTVINMLLTSMGKDQNPTLNELHTINISECINETLMNYPFQPQEREQYIQWENNSDFIFYGSHPLMVHVLFNLMQNALYFIHKAGRGKIYIELSHGETHNSLSIKDTGTGIPKARLAHIFDAFYTTREMGTGIGLSFCKMVMQDLGGNIHCESVEGEFTQFILKFPLVK